MVAQRLYWTNDKELSSFRSVRLRANPSVTYVYSQELNSTVMGFKPQKL